MRSVSIRQLDMKQATIPLGFEGENEFTEVRIDCKKTFDQHPNAVPSMIVTDPAGNKYPAVVTRDGDVVVWQLTAGDLTTNGYGEIQIEFLIDGTVIGKTDIARTRIERSIFPEGEAPEPVQNWIDEANQTLAEVEEAKQAFPAGGTTGQVLTKKSDEDYDTEWKTPQGGGGGTSNYNDLDNKPSINGVTLSGNKSLSDLSIPSQEDVNAKYTKPQGGIPASDIDPSAIPSPTSIIDDNAGEGDTNKVLSADKVTEITDGLREAITNISESVSIPSRNFFDDSDFQNKSGITISNGEYYGQSTDFKNSVGAIMPGDFEVGKRYTFSAYGKTDGAKGTDGNGLAIRIFYTDDTYTSEYFTNDISSYTRKSVTSVEGKNVSHLKLENVKYYNQVWYLKQFQVEEGTSATEYISPDSGGTELIAKDAVARAKMSDVLPWYSAFEDEPLRIAYSGIWVDKINTATHWLFASDMGFNVLKGDVEITSDGKLIMCHDPGFTFDGNGRITTYDSEDCTLIVNMTYAECRAKVYADLPSRYGDYCPVADIDDFLRICKEKGKIAFVTIRGTNTANVVNALADKIIFYGMESRTIINALSISLLQTVRTNHKCDNIALNYIASTNTAITKGDVDSAISIGRCFLSVWCNESTTIVDNSATAIEYAKQKGIPILSALISSISMWNYLIENGVMGSQISKPIFDVEPKNYRFKLTVDDGAVMFGNLFASDRFTGTAILSGTTLSVSDICLTDSYLTGVIDGIQPIKMNMLDPVIRCFDQSGNTIPCVWSNNALVLTLSNTNDNTYTVIVTV